MPRKKSKEFSLIDMMNEVVDEEEDDNFNLKCKAYLLTFHLRDLDDYDKLEKMHKYFKELFPEATTTSKLETTEQGLMHQHVYQHHPRQIEKSADDLAYQGYTPDCRPNRVKGSGYHNAVSRGHWYLQNIFKNSNVHCISDMLVQDVKLQWIRTQHQEGKIDDDNLERCALHYNCWTQPFARDAAGMIAAKKAMFYEKKMADVKAVLDGKLMKFKTYTTITEWRKQYDKIMFRFMYLIIWGEKSMCGKTQLAKSQFKNPFIHSTVIDWKGYDYEKHDGIIFDDVCCIYKYISDNRALFQAGNEYVTVHTTANGGANAYAFKIYVYQKPMVITCNTGVTAGSWIDQNSFKLHVEGPTWYEEGKIENYLQPQEEPPPKHVPCCKWANTKLCECGMTSSP